MPKQELATFNLSAGGEVVRHIRVVQDDGSPWFVTSDVCRPLGWNPSRGVSRYLGGLDADERRVIMFSEIAPRNFRATKGGVNLATQVSLISESGLNKLIMRAQTKNPAVRAFQDWVTRIVLPAIRKDGAYVVGEEKVASGEISEDEFILKAMTILQGKVTRITAKRDRLADAVQSTFTRTFMPSTSE